MKTKILSLSMIFILSLGLLSNCYADQYIQNLHDQMIRHLETQGYHFTNIDNGWHTLKPMQSICGEVIYPINDPHKLTVTINYKGVFRQEFAYLQTGYINYKKVSYGSDRSRYGQWVYDRLGEASFVPYSISPDSQIKEAKSCIQNVSRHANLYINFSIDPYQLTIPN